MIKIEAYVRPERLEAVKNVLGKFGIRGMTVLEAIGCGLQKGHTEVVNGHEYDLNLLPKTKIEIIVADSLSQDVVKLIADHARTGKIGDGKIFTYPVGNAVRIRTGETGDSVI
ncbi:nitrogen regulatory protein P-II [Peptococcaceae bacterium CEB3]|nr:nitrogen regulatory protein P-II [Peptococcaceae bacterium CEB3]